MAAWDDLDETDAWPVIFLSLQLYTMLCIHQTGCWSRYSCRQSTVKQYEGSLANSKWKQPTFTWPVSRGLSRAPANLEWVLKAARSLAIHCTRRFFSSPYTLLLRSQFAGYIQFTFERAYLKDDYGLYIWVKVWKVFFCCCWENRGFDRPSVIIKFNVQNKNW